MRLYFLIILCYIYLPVFCQSGVILYADNFNGGVTGDGYSPDAGFGGTGFFQVNIPSGSSIRNAFLFAGKHGITPPTTIVFSGNSLIFESSNQIIPPFFSPFGGNASLHMVDVTQYINSSTSNYQITIPQQSNNALNRFSDFYLYVVYENVTMSETTIYVFINSKGMNNDIRTYNINNLSKINNIFDVGVSLFTGYLCDTLEGENVYINNNYLGLIGLPDINSGSCGGTKGSFYYNNNILFGLQDDIPNNLMNGSDAICDAKNYILNNDTMVSIRFETESTNNNTNVIWAIFLAYTSNCSFTTTATAIQDTICLGDSVQLNATGGATYNWYSPFSIFNDTTLANPLATPSQTTTYIVTIKNDSGCVKTEHVKIWVTQPIDSISTTPTTCGNATGSITAHYNTNVNYNFTLYDNNFNLLSNNSTGIFNQLADGTYIVENTLQNCTFYDTVIIGYINITVANFNTSPSISIVNPTQPLGKAPFEVGFFNTSQNANMFQWSITQQPNNDTIVEIPVCTGMTSNCGLQHFFTEGGVYEVCLIAYNNQPQCADTVCKTIFIDANEEISLFIPNVFTPNGDNENDNFVIQLIGAAYLESLEVQVFNRWGMLVQGLKFDVPSLVSEIPASAGMKELVIWNGISTAGNKASEGTYFYVISYTTKTGETITEKGTVSLLR